MWELVMLIKEWMITEKYYLGLAMKKIAPNIKIFTASHILSEVWNIYSSEDYNKLISAIKRNEWMR